MKLEPGIVCFGLGEADAPRRKVGRTGHPARREIARKRAKQVKLLALGAAVVRWGFADGHG
ncbi:hypothetical protein ACQPTN_05130 [Bradyrhizobium sp. 13971]